MLNTYSTCIHTGHNFAHMYVPLKRISYSSVDIVTNHLLAATQMREYTVVIRQPPN